MSDIVIGLLYNLLASKITVGDTLKNWTAIRDIALNTLEEHKYKVAANKYKARVRFLERYIRSGNEFNGERY